MTVVFDKISTYLRMIKFSHSIFALPFAFTSAIIASSGIPTSKQIFWIVVAMVSARSGAMGLNRVIDIDIDRKNPRTSSRELPRGVINLSEALVFIIVSFGIMIFSAYMLNPLCLKLSPLAISVLILYSYTKRFTWASHFVLGLAISAAPLGAWIAVKGVFDPEILALGAAIVFWLAGFDILYALQDIDFDKEHGLYSIPKRFGTRRSLHLSRIFHMIAFLLFITNGLIFDLSGFYWAGIIITAGLLLYEHSLIKENDLRKLNMAFFNMNGYISMTIFVFTLMDYLI